MGNINLLKINPKTSLYSKISNTSIVKNELPSIPLIPVSGDKYFAKKFIKKSIWHKIIGKFKNYLK